MAHNTPTIAFQTIEIYGSILPSSILEDLAKLNRPKELHLDATDYCITKGERLRDRIDAAWIHAKKLWDDYQDLKNRSLSLAGLDLSQRLLREVFSWTDIKRTSGLQIDDSYYQITHSSFKGSVHLIIKSLDQLELDQGTYQFGNENRRRSPHSCLQECLNADDNAEWGLLMSGNQIRLLHDNSSLVKPAYLNVDMELLIEGNYIDEFSVLWLLLHSSRFRKNQHGYCILDKWKKEVEKSGERIRGALHKGVKNALVILGNGFLNHKKNDSLRHELFESNALSAQEFHEQLLRLIYRFLFLLTTEDRNLLFPKSFKDFDTRREIYKKGYSVNRLRELSINRSAYECDYEDIWYLQKLVFHQLNISNSPLGLPGLGGIFSIEHCRDLENCEISNDNFLKAIKEIAWFTSNESGVLTRVCYRDLNTEELGSVYEGLLELHPQLESVGASWILSYGDVAGSERKTSGSYYTPESLVKEIIKNTLDPVVEDRLTKSSNNSSIEKELLKIKIIDPACGSGHFLLAAARKLALVLAETRSANNQPSEKERKAALRDVVANCIYGVDKNPMAVELCKVALWIEAVEPGKPLSFLDLHIQCGDSLVGILNKNVLKELIPDSAYIPLRGDDKIICKSLKEENITVKKTMTSTNQVKTYQGCLDLSSQVLKSSSQEDLQIIEAMPQETFSELSAKKKAYNAYLSQKGKDYESLAADLYTAAFFLQKKSNSRETVPTSEHLLNVFDGNPIPEVLEKAVLFTAKKFRFFHWYLRFSEVMENGGFDCIIGNPPWDKVKVLDKEFFEKYLPTISKERNKNIREKMIYNLSISSNAYEAEIYEKYEMEKVYSACLARYIKSSQRYKLSTKGEINLYTALFETSIQLKNKFSAVGIVLPSGIFADKNNEEFARFFILSGELRLLVDFINKRNIFKGIGSNVQFCILSLSKLGSGSFKMACRLQSIDGIKNSYVIKDSEIKLINPNTLHIPAISTIEQKNLIVKIYQNSAHLLSKSNFGENSGWDIEFHRMFDMSLDSGLFSKEIDLRQIHEFKYTKEWVITNQDGKKYLPLYEGKLIDSYNHRSSTFNNIEESKIYGTKPKTNASTDLDLKDFSWHPKPRYWVKESEVKNRLSKKWVEPWLITFRNTISSGADTRSLRVSIIPAFGCGNSLPIIYEYSGGDYPFVLVGILNSIVIDFVVKQKVSGGNLNFYIMEQLPIPRKENLSTSDIEFISSRVKSLSFTSTALSKRKEHCAINQNLSWSPILDEYKRSEVKAEIDVYIAKLFGLTRLEMEFLLDDSTDEIANSNTSTFSALKSVELKEFGEYRSKRLCLEAWDRLFN